MKYFIKRTPDEEVYQLILEGQNSEEDEVLYALYLNGSIIALGQTEKGHYELVLRTSPADHRVRG